MPSDAVSADADANAVPGVADAGVAASAEVGPAVEVGYRVGPGEPVEVTAATVDPLDAWVSGVAGVPAGPARALPTLPAVIALTAAAGWGGPAALLTSLLTGRTGAAVVHGDQRIEALRPVRIGDRLVFASEVESVRALGGATVLAVGTSVTSGTGEAVATLRSVFVLTGATGRGAA